jgi:hypothetical protein
MWIVRRITSVRTSTGFRAASTAVGVLDGRSANAAKTPAASAVAAAAARVCLLRMPCPSSSWRAPLCPRLGQPPTNAKQSFGKAHARLTHI